MVYREIFETLESKLHKKPALVITGMRRVGKTTALKFLLGKVQSSNKIYLDLEKVENRYIFQQPSYKDIEISLKIEGINFEKKAYIAIDEIQLVPEITSVIKYFYDNYDIKFLLTGSSSFYLKHHFTESLAGRKQIIEINTLSFPEYLKFTGKDIPYKTTSGFFNFNVSFYQRFKEDYDTYLLYGGFPEIALIKDENDKLAYLKDIVNSCIELDIKLLSDFSVSKDLYNLMLLLSKRIGSKVDNSKLAAILGINRNKVRQYIEFLEYTYFLRLLPVYVKNKDIELSRQKKIYFTDNGIATVLGNKTISQLFENTIANQLSRYGELMYYSKKSGQEIDFILNKEIAFEVKQTPTNGDLNTLKRRGHSIDISQHHLIGLTPGNSNFRDFIWGGNI